MLPAQPLLWSKSAVCRIWARDGASAQRRRISMGHIRKTEEAQEKWESRARLIKQGKLQNTWDLLVERGYVKDTAGSREVIGELMRTRRIGAYTGVDPTASSLHIGHLLPLMPLFWMYLHGYGAFTLIGGSTAKIGDPTGRLKTRERIPKADLAMNLTKIHYQLKKIWENVEAQARRFGYEKEWAWKRGVLNNNHWWNSLPMLEVLKRVGHSMRLGPMLSRDTVKQKMRQGDGVSFAEFTYPIMQGWDWWELLKQRKVQMQIGGSDQYGNIVAGVDIVKAARDNEPDPAARLPAVDEYDDPVGFTVPLLTDSSGAKFGKSAGNAVWLDEYMTSTFDLYGYFVRRPDADVERLLRLLTFLPGEEIRRIMEAQQQDPPKRVAHHTLAYEVVALVHGEPEAKKAREQHELMYQRGTSAIDLAKARDIDVNSRFDMRLPESLVKRGSIGRILYAAGLATSVTEGHRLAQQRAAHIAGLPGRRVGSAEPMNPSEITWNPIKLWFPQETQKYLIDGKLLILRRGRHNVRIIKVVSDEEFELGGWTYPGQAFTGKVRRLREQLKLLKAGLKKPQEVRDELKKIDEEEGANAKGGDAGIKFPTNNPVQLELEAQIQDLLRTKEEDPFGGLLEAEEKSKEDKKKPRAGF